MSDEQELPAYLQVFQEFWSPVLVEDGELNPDKIARELYDYSLLLDAVPLVYSHITCGQISKPFTEPRVVIGVADDCADKTANDEVRYVLERLQDRARGLEGETPGIRLRNVCDWIQEWLDEHPVE